MIKLLDQKTIDKIAAGEVIERPASIVKELVENSIDAGATRISIEIRDGGTSFIRVTDNGCGIPKEQIRTAYLRHATSKLETVEDLVGVSTLGFRGEALATIAAVTETEMITKTKDSLSAVKYSIRGGNEIEFCETGAPDGTTIIAKNIFFNTPVRLKFLKSNMTEGSYINDLVSQIALSHPEIAFNLVSNGRTIVDTRGTGSLKDTVYQLFGKEITKNLIPCDFTMDTIRITGFVGKPFLSRDNRSFEYYYINKRFIKNAIVNRAIEEAYKTYVMQHRFPFVILYIELNGEECDVNVHPTKKEFKYNNEKLLFSAVFHAVQEALSERSMIPTADVDYGQRDKGYTGSKDRIVSERKTAVEHVKTSINSVAEHVAETEKPVVNTQTERDTPQIKDITPVKENLQKKEVSPVKADTSVTDAAPTKSEPVSASKKTSSGSSLGVKQVQVGQAISAGGDSYSLLKKLLPESFRTQLKESIDETPNKPASPVQTEASAKTESAVEEEQYYSFSNAKFRQAELEDDDFLSKDAKPKHEIIGQIFGTYWITTYKGAMYLMDQHAAHEKINYERFLKEFKNKQIESQQIFPPMIISLTSAEKTAVLENIEKFEKTGFDISDFGGNDVKLSSLPVNLAGLSGEDVFLEFVSYLTDGVSGVTEDIFVHKIATMGCKAAIKGGAKWQITKEEASHIMEELMTLDNPYTCPHGRPTIVKMTKEEIDKKFKRIVE